MTEASSREPLSFQQALELLGDPEAAPTVGIVDRLSAPSADDLDAFRACWTQLNVPRRRWIAGELVTSCEANIHVDFKQLFVFLLDDDDPEVRSSSIDGLWEARDASLADRFTDMLSTDVHAAVRARAATALGPFVEMGQLEELDAARTNRAVDALAAAARDEGEDGDVRRRATESVGYADYTDAGAVIEEAYASTDRGLRAGAVHAMGNSADQRWATTVLSLLDDPEPEFRFEAARASGELAISDAVPKLVWLAADDDLEIQLEAIWSLGEIGGSEARRALESLLSSSEDEQLDEALEDALAMVALWDGELFWGAVPDEH